MSTLPPEELQYQLDHAHEDHSRELGAFFILCMVLSVIAVAMRLVSRKMSEIPFRADDYSMIVGLIIAEGSFAVLVIYAFEAGLGKHLATLTPYQLALFSKLNYAYNILNVFAYPWVKVSILMLYWRIFNNKVFRQFVYFGVAFLACVCISNTLVAVFSCQPIRGFWDKTIPAKCIDDIKFYWANASLNVVTDVFVLILPMPMTWRLQMPLRQKIGLTALFLLGGLTCVISCLRIVYYLDVTATDVSYTYIGCAYATPGELTLAIIVGCLPTVRPLSRGLLAIARNRSSYFRKRYLSGKSYASDRTDIHSSSDEKQSYPGTLQSSGTKPENPINSSTRAHNAPSNGLPNVRSTVVSNNHFPDSEMDLESGDPHRINVQRELHVARD